jgi:hypothetical protein
MTAKKAAKPFLEARKSRHGDFSIQSGIAQGFKEFIRGSNGGATSEVVEHMAARWPELGEPKREAIDMILHKIARIVAGDAEFDDHWRDIAGYATRAQETCETQTDPA